MATPKPPKALNPNFGTGGVAPSVKKAEEMKKAAIAAASRGPAPSKNTSAERPVTVTPPRAVAKKPVAVAAPMKKTVRGR